MIDVSEIKETCFAKIFYQCTLLTKTDCNNCNFYKPKGCEDWVRLERDGRTVLLAPEEYEKRYSL